MALFTGHTITPDSALGGKIIDKSLRFNGDDTYLNRTPSTAGNRSKWTWSAWVKRTKFGTAQDLYSAYDARGFYNIIRFGTDDQLNFQSNSAEIKKTNHKFRDASSWYHIVVAVDTPNTTAADRVIIYVNGSRETLATDNQVLPSQVFAFNTTQPHTLGVYANTSSYNFDGYMADIHFRDGQALDPTYFGYTESQTGMWLPKPYIGTFTNVNSNSLNDGTTWNSTYANAFNGTATDSGAGDGAYTGLNSTFTINFPGSGVVVNSSLQFQGYAPASAQSTFDQYVDIYVNGTERTCTIVSGSENGTHSAVHNIDFTGTMTSLRMQSKPTSNNGISQVIVDGEILINGLDARGNNSFHLDFIDNSGTTATTLGKDISGNANNYTPNNFSVSAGTGNDSLLDSPTNNFVTLNPLRRQDDNCTLSEGNLKATGSNESYPGASASVALTSGKWYYEFQIDSKTSNPICGICQYNYKSGGTGRIMYRADGVYIMSNSSEPTDPDTFGVGDIIGDAIDLDHDDGLIRFYKNGTLQTVNTALNNVKSNLSISTLGGVLPYIQMYTGDACTVNFGQRAFNHTPPTGHRALNSRNLATPSSANIVRPQRFFDSIVYTGDTSGNLKVTGLEFKPDFVWIKRRTGGTDNHQLFDTVRDFTNGRRLFSNGDSSEAQNGSQYGMISVNDDGFTVGAGPFEANRDGDSHVAWCWKAGGTAVSNSDGSITSSVSASTEAGFSIGTFTGTGSNGSIGHGLGKVPAMIIAKSRTHTDNWFVYHKSLGANAYIMLNQTSAADTNNSTVWQNVAPTSSVFYSSTGGYNDSGQSLVFYCWAEIPGFSKFGLWTSLASTDGTFINTGFKPAWVMAKQTSGSGGNWFILDNKRSPFNVANDILDANESTAERNADVFDFVSNGFKIRLGFGTNETFMYMAFAEQPSETMFGLDANAR